MSSKKKMFGKKRIKKLEEQLAETNRVVGKVEAERDAYGLQVDRVLKEAGRLQDERDSAVKEAEAAIRQRDSLKEYANDLQQKLKANIDEINRTHEWLERFVYPHLQSAEKVVLRLKECQDAFKIPDTRYPWNEE